VGLGLRSLLGHVEARSVSGFTEGDLDGGGWALGWGVCVASVG
jgi:hypothetical protein